MVTAPIAVNGRRVEGSAEPEGHRRLTRAVGIAIGTLALGALAALLVAAYEDHLLTPLGGASAHVQLPGDLFLAPRAPQPRIVVRYVAPRSAPVPSTPAAVAATATAAPATPTPSGRHHPSASPTPPGGDD